MSPHNILVLGVGGNVSIGIVKAIKSSNIDAYVVGACIQKYAAGFAFCDKNLLSPHANSPEFLSWLQRTLEDNNIHVVLSGVEEINNILSNHVNLRKETKILAPLKNQLEIFNDKLATVNWLAKNNIEHPKTLDLREKYSFSQIEKVVGLPFIVKPRIGKGSAGVVIIESEQQYQELKNKNECISQQLIGDANTEYTCGVYKSKYGYMEIIIMRRFLRNGSTIIAEVEKNKIIYNYCKEIADSLDASTPFNIQLRLCKDSYKPYSFEINMRLSGTTAIRHGFGFKDCQVWIKESLFKKSFQCDFNVKPGVALRYEAEVFLSKTDLLNEN